MSLQKLVGVLSRVKTAAESFRNPVFRNYFVGKAEEELSLLRERGASMPSSELESRLHSNTELEAILLRQTTVHNLYYVSDALVDK
ncbi:hypothetical protein, conserved [Babesia bigemina]|uniref:Uncharacterized protein n=1 Tax=Babesia bigemina TaxID=5866 RepID=A0A061D9X2_BABBI|nr:hypothetical protein, conserved [Babesia bigemina]CDR95714.1 hypothetical protein, conserved [Babesia bigemina]|eukprot:XP_012767900.1 hypothetical protein, conserved [Babesia bigemina]